MKKAFTYILVLIVILDLTMISVDATTPVSPVQGEGSDGSWFDILIGQNNISSGGCTWCSLMMLLQNSGTITKPEYQIPHNTNITNITSDVGIIAKNAFLESKGAICYDPHMSTAEGGRPIINGGNCAYRLDKINEPEGYAKGWQRVTFEGNDLVITGLGGIEFKNMDKDALITSFKTFWNAGYWVEVFIDYKSGASTGQHDADHAIAFCGVTNDNIYFADPNGDKGGGIIRSWDGVCDKYGHNYQPKITALHLYSNEFSSPMSLAGGGIAYNSTDAGNYASMGLDASTVYAATAEGNGLTEEQLSTFCRLGEPISIYEDLVSTSLDELSQDEFAAIADWEQYTEDTSSGGLISVLRTVVATVGILLIVWSILFYIAFWLDKLTFIPTVVKLTRIISFYKLEAAEIDEEATYGTNKGASFQTINHKDCLKICIIAMLFGVAILTGSFYRLIFLIVNTAQNAIHRAL